MELLAESKFIEKKSKFFSFLYLIDSLNEAKDIITLLKKKHVKANHVCYAIVCEGETIFKNDGEVGHPGKGLLNLLEEKEKKSHILIVARYFGGIKLGPGGVSRAFRNAVKMCFE